MYADDTTLYFNLEDIDSVDMNDNINIHLEKINVWLKLNQLTVNVSKTKFMIFHKRRDTPQLDLLLNNIKIEQVSNFTFIGIILDTSLYHGNIRQKLIAIKISKIIGILPKLKYIFPKEILLIIYKSLIVPHLNYGLLLWGVNSGVVGRERMGTAFPHKKLSGNGVPTREILRDIFLLLLLN